MKLSVPQKTLSKALSDIHRVVPARSTLSILKNVALSTEDGKLKLSGTDLTMSVTRWIDAKIDEIGSATVPVATLADLVGVFPDKKVSIDKPEDKKSLNVKCGTFKTRINTMPIEDFPVLSVDHPTEALINFDAKELIEIIKQVSFATFVGEARPMLTGMLIEIKDQEVKFAGADGFRLSVRSKKLPAPVTIETQKAVVPTNVMREVAHLADGQEVVSLSLSAERPIAIFDFHNGRLITLLLEGDYPDFSGIIGDQKYDTKAVVNVDSFKNYCKAADIFAREEAHVGKFTIKPSKGDKPGTIKITGMSQEHGHSEGVIDATIEGEGMDVGFNLRMVSDFLSVVDEASISIYNKGPKTPGMFRPIGRDDFLHVIMPMTSI